MDSPDSGSPKSSSGRDDDYDSRAATADFINTHHPPQPLFDPFSHYTQHHHGSIDAFNNNNNNNPNPPWPGSNTLRSGPNPNPDHHAFINPFANSFPQPQQPLTTSRAAETNNNNPGGSSGAAAPARNPRKRSRASRRAPTTVLTTDTTNFRAMVQEFTGIPAPPFSHPCFPRPNRLDSLFGPSRSGAAASMEAPSFLHQRYQPPPPQFLSSNPMINYQHHHHPSPPPSFASSHDVDSNNNNNQSQFFSSLLQTNPAKFTFSAPPKPHNRAGSSVNLGPGPEEFGLGGLGNHHLRDLPSLISPDQGPARINRGDDEEEGNAAKWRRNGNADDGDSDGDDGRLKPVNGYDFNQVEKQSGSGPENQGMVESWINSSE